MAKWRDQFWWCASPEKAPDVVWRHLQNLSGWRSRFLQRMATLTHLFERESWEEHPGYYLADGQQQSRIDYRDRHNRAQTSSHPASLNAYKSSLLYVAGRMFQEIPAVELSPEGGDYRVTEQCKTITHALNATINAPLNLSVLRERGLRGLNESWSALMPTVRGGRVCFDALDFECCWWDPEDARSGNPQSFHVARPWQRNELISYLRSLEGSQLAQPLAKLLRRISNIPPGLPHGPQTEGEDYEYYDWWARTARQPSQHDQLWVVQSWRLPGGEGDDVPVYSGQWSQKAEDDLAADAGRALVSVHGGEHGTGDNSVTIHDLPWRRTSYPVVWWSPIPHKLGIDGQGLGDICAPYQTQIDIMWGRFSHLIQNWGDTKVLVANNMQDQKRNIAANNVTFIKAPDGVFQNRQGPGFAILPSDPLSEQQLQFLQFVIASMREQAAINPGGPSGQTRLGANAAGIALMEEDAKQDMALSFVDQQWDAFVLHVGEQLVYAIADASEVDKDFEVPFEDAEERQRRLVWSKITDGLDRWTMRLEPVGVLGKGKAGRIQRALELGRYGAVDGKLVAQTMRRSPDVARLQREANAPLALVEWQLNGLSEEMRNEEDYAPFWPDDNTPHALGIETALNRLQQATVHGLPDAIRQRIDTYIMQCQHEMNKKTQAMAMARAGQPAGGLGQPPMAPEMGMEPGLEPAAEPGVPPLPTLPI